MLFTDPTLRRCLLIGCGLTLLQQFTGQPNVLYYGSTLFKAAGFESDREATLANLAIGGMKVLATGVALIKVDSLGRRPLLLVGTAVMVVSLVVLASVTTVFPPTAVSHNGTLPNATTTTTTTSTALPATTLVPPTTTATSGNRSLAARSFFDLLAPTDGGGGGSGGGSGRVRREAIGASHADTDDLVFSSAAVKWTSLASMILFVVAYAFR